MKKFNLVAQEDPMGCAVACVASLLGLSYKKTLRLFDKNKASTKGYYLKDIVLVLKKKRVKYRGAKITDKTKKYINKAGSIVFIKRSKKYPAGHYLLKTKNGWMNPWLNYPKINPARAGFMKKLPGKAQWILYKI